MTEAQTPKVIVVAEDAIYQALHNTGAAWDLQTRCPDVNTMWDMLGAGQLDQTSQVVVFSDQDPTGFEALAASVAPMAPAALTFVVNWTGNWEGVTQAVAAAAKAQGVEQNAQIYRLDPTSDLTFLESLRAVLGDFVPAADPTRVAMPLVSSVPVPVAPVAVPEYPAQVPNDPYALAHGTDPAFQPSAPLAPPVVPPVPVYDTPAYPSQPPTQMQPPVAYPPVAPQPAYEAPVVPQPAYEAPIAPQPAYPMPSAAAYPSAPQTVFAQPSAPAYPQGPNQGYYPQPSAAPVYEPPAPVSDPNDLLSLPPLDGQVTIAVTSSKGGSGKSTTALELAAAIAQSSAKAAAEGMPGARPLRVVLVDMDTRDGQVASLIGRYIPTALNIRVAPKWDKQTILQNLVHDDKLGIDALLAPVRPRTADDVGPDFYRDIINSLKRTHDVVIMDTSVNYLDPLISTVCLPEATAILFVTTLATTSVQGMARALREITEPVENGGMGIKRSKIGIVVNQSVADVGMQRDQVVQAALHVNIVGAVPLASRDVLTATNYNRMHALLRHPHLGPAYFNLAKACMKNRVLSPIIDTPSAATLAASADGAQPQDMPASARQQPAAPPESAGKAKGLFGKRR